MNEENMRTCLARISHILCLPTSLEPQSIEEIDAGTAKLHPHVVLDFIADAIREDLEIEHTELAKEVQE